VEYPAMQSSVGLCHPVTARIPAVNGEVLRLFIQ